MYFDVDDVQSPNLLPVGPASVPAVGVSDRHGGRSYFASGIAFMKRFNNQTKLAITTSELADLFSTVIGSRLFRA